MNEDLIKTELRDGEKLIWQGKPAKRFLTKHEMIRVPVSTVLVVAFAIYWFSREDVSSTMIIVAALALLYVSYNIFVTLLIKNNRRKRTIYALTDSRLLFILADKNDKVLKSAEIEIAKIAASAVDMNKDGTGSLLFSEKKSVDTFPLRAGNNWTNRKGIFLSAAVFFDIEDPEEVLTEYREIHKETKITDNSSSEGEKAFSKYDE